MALSEPVKNRQEVEAVLSAANAYYHRLIDWNNAEDPLLKLVSPAEEEPAAQGIWGASDEEGEYLIQGYRHKYRSSAFLMLPESEAREGLAPGMDYIAENPEIRQVIVAGGDCLSLPTVKLRKIIEDLRKIPHVGIIRLSTKVPVVDPMRVYEDENLLELLRQNSTPEKRIYMMAHIHHPREMTPEATLALTTLQDSGAIVVNRTPILRGVNDDPAVLGALLDRLSWAGVTPYYFFLDRPAAGKADRAVPLERAYRLVEEAKVRTSGLGRRARLCVNHESGLIEVLAIEAGKAYLKFHASLDDDAGKFLTVDCSEDTVWFDQMPSGESFTERRALWATDSGPLPAYLKKPYEIGD